MKDEISKLKKKLLDSAKTDKPCGLLFSGGLDSAILASINPGIKAITVNLRSYGEDTRYAKRVAKFFNIEHSQKTVAIDEAIEAIPEVIKILKTFDPAIPNDLVVYFGLKLAKESGIKEVMTGDGSDELFAGYDFMQKMNNLPDYIKRISQKMRFSPNLIGEFFDIEIIQPFLNKGIIEFALSVSTDLKIKKRGGRVYGKWILRKAFEGILPEEIIWQNKRPLEYGSGMTRLRTIISEKVSDDEFRENSYPVKFMNKEHFYYYKIYRAIFGDVPKPSMGEKVCPGCATGMNIDALHCGICGYVLV